MGPLAPIVVVPAPGAVVSGRPVISGTAEAGVWAILSLNGVFAGFAAADGVGNWSFTPSTAFPAGAHTLTVQARDSAGQSSDSNARSFTVDTGAPQAPVVLTPANGAL